MSSRNTSNIEVNDDGSIIVLESEREKDRRIRREHLEHIREGITNPNYDPAEASRLIAVEIARVTEDLSDCFGDGPMDTTRLKVLEAQLKALRELGKQLTDADLLSKKDVLNMDGAKFIWVLGVIVDNFVQAMKEAGVQEELRMSILKHYRDKMQVNEAQIRKDIQKVS